MASRPHRTAQALVQRYLDASRPWTAAAVGELRVHLRDCDPCRDAYRRAVVSHRVMVGSPADMPSGFEQRRMADAVIEGALGPASALGSSSPAAALVGWRAALGALGACAAAALVFFFVQPPVDPGPESDPTFRARGASGSVERPLAGLGISGVTEAGDEYEAVASDAAIQGDWLRFYYSNEDPRLGHLFVVGLQAGRAPIWYAPMPPEEAESLAIGQGKQIKLPMESRVSARHAAAPLAVVALFTARPLGVDVVGPALDRSVAGLASSALEAALRERLGLEAGDVVQVLETRVVPRSGEVQ